MSRSHEHERVLGAHRAVRSQSQVAGRTRTRASAPLYPRCILGSGGSELQRNLCASDAERQAVARRLERALRDGHRTIVEFDERVQAAYAAHTRGDLEDLAEDLPADLW